jgi:hypothetical protein
VWGLLALALALSLALSPVLSRMHHVLHPGHGAPVLAAQVHTPEVLAATERSALERLFGTHAEGSQVCQLLDHTGSADGAAPALEAVLLDVPALLVPCPFNASCAANTVAFFQARGPPALL